MRLKVNLSTGETLTFNIPEELAEWSARASDPEFQGQIRGLIAVRGDDCYALPQPKAFRTLIWGAEAALEGGALQALTISCHADEVMVRGTIYANKNPSMVRFDARRIGRQRWSPNNKVKYG